VGNPKAEVITFKVDETLSGQMTGISNRSEFIRNAILSALGNLCPLCNGTGTISVCQREHWEEFSKHHHLQACTDCHEVYLVCDHEA
jgi:metal-responsive CopG/Arc/MetJ family transcriptional regulator